MRKLFTKVKKNQGSFSHKLTFNGISYWNQQLERIVASLFKSRSSFHIFFTVGGLNQIRQFTSSTQWCHVGFILLFSPKCSTPNQDHWCLKLEPSPVKNISLFSCQIFCNLPITLSLRSWLLSSWNTATSVENRLGPISNAQDNL